MLTKNIVTALLILYSLWCFGCVENISVDNENINFETESIYRPINDSEIELTKTFIDSLPKLFPVDESSLDSSFSAFVVKLLTAITDKDTSFIYQMLDSNILNSFGGDGGIEEFKQSWRIGSNESRFWEIFRSTIDLGGTFLKDTSQFMFPYVSSLWPPGFDGFFFGALITDHGIVYRSTDLQTTFDTTSYSVFERLQWTVTSAERDDLFVPVKIGNYRYGFLKRSDFRSPIDYRCFFIRESSSWKLRHFIAGD